VSVQPTTNAQPTVSAAGRVPPGVRTGAPGAKQAYATAQAFEQMLVSELTQALVQGAGIEESETGASAASAEGLGGDAGGAGESSSSGAGPLAALVPQALSESIMRQGGLGLAGPLTVALDPAAGEQGAAHVQAQSGGASAGGA
jgi:hypothetical protein